jgi:putative hemolysin
MIYKSLIINLKNMQFSKKLTFAILAFVAIIITIIVATVVISTKNKVEAPENEDEITSFVECEAAGFPIMESYPRQCAANGETFVEEIDNSNSLCTDMCGDGVCQEIVCLSEGCPCAETVESCPLDCKSDDSDNSTGLANPASVYCEEQGGTSEIQTATDGSQNGVCKFVDGRECDEWEFYNTKVCE